MATRFYLHAATDSTTGLPSAEQSSLTSEKDFEGSQTTNRQMTTTIGAGQTSLATNTIAADANSHTYYCSRWVSPPIYQASVAANTWTYNFATSEAGASTNFPVSGNNGPVRVNCYVWRPSNTSKVGTILDGNTASTVDENTSGEAVHHVTFGGSVVNNVQNGDVIIFEAWFIVDPATGGNNTAMTFYYDGTTANTTDNSNPVSNHASFIETPENLVLTAPTPVSQTYTHIYNIKALVAQTYTHKANIKNLVQAPSLVFDGTNQYIDCGNHADLWSQGLTKFSFSVWIYPTLQDASVRDVLRHGSAGSRFFCTVDATGGNIGFSVRLADNSVSRTATATTLTLNQWNHIVGVYDNSLGSANIKIYRNKVVGGTTASLTETPNVSAILTLSNSSTDFKGNMKDFRWWTTRALTQTEIDNVYANSTSAPACDYYLPMNENTGNPVDFVAGKTTTLQNSPTWEARSPEQLRGRVFTQRYNIRNLAGQTFTHIYNILSNVTTVAQTYTHKYNIRVLAAQTYTHKYNIRNLVNQVYTHKWNIRSLAAQTFTQKYNIKNLVNQTFTHKYNIINFATKTFTHRYNIKNLVNQTYTHKWNIKTLVSQIFTHKYNIKTLAAQIFTHKYNIKTLVAQTFTHKYNIRTLVNQVYTHKYGIKTLVAQTYTQKYNIANLASQIFTHKYNIINFVSQTFTHVYNILGLGAVSKTFTHIYNINILTSQTYTHKWNIKNLIAQTFSHKYNIKTLINQIFTHKWNIHNLASQVFTHKYNIRNLVNQLFTQRYDIRNLVSQTFTHFYNILTVGLVAAVFTHKYNIRNLTSQTYTQRYNIKTIINKIFTHRYNISQSVSQLFTHRYSIRNLAGQTYTQLYNIRNLVNRTYTHKWNITQLVSQIFTHKYNIRALVSQLFTHRYNITNVMTVANTFIHRYNINTLVSNSFTHRYDIHGLAVTVVGKIKEWLFNTYQGTDPSKS